jgi:hypothetical protein
MPFPALPSRPRRLAVLTLLLALLGVAVTGAGAPAQTGPASGGAPTSDCFGAAARDPQRPCRDARLRLSVFPLPADAVLEPNARCTPTGQTPVLLPCAFGVPKKKAEAVIALIGDSHASHWRAAVEGVARQRAWRGISITRSGCPFSKAVARLQTPARGQCERWNREVLAWLQAHPEVRTVFVSQHRGGRVLVPRGASNQKAQIAGYMDVWKALPASVTRIFVIRDTPRDTGRTADCLTRAMQARRPPGPACALRRQTVLKPDPAAIAVKRLASARVKLIDMSPFMCSARLCLPVIGGALVHKDLDHLTQTFAATLGPLLARRVAALGVPGP